MKDLETLQTSGCQKNQNKYSHKTGFPV